MINKPAPIFQHNKHVAACKPVDTNCKCLQRIEETLSARNSRCLCVASCAALVEGIRTTHRPCYVRFGETESEDGKRRRDASRELRSPSAAVYHALQLRFYVAWGDLAAAWSVVYQSQSTSDSTTTSARGGLKLVTNWRQRRDKSVDANFQPPSTPFSPST